MLSLFFRAILMIADDSHKANFSISHLVYFVKQKII